MTPDQIPTEPDLRQVGLRLCHAIETLAASLTALGQPSDWEAARATRGGRRGPGYRAWAWNPSDYVKPQNCPPCSFNYSFDEAGSCPAWDSCPHAAVLGRGPQSAEKTGDDDGA